MAGYRIDSENKKVITPVARASYVAILEKKATKNEDGTEGKESWGTMLLFPKSDPDVPKFVKEYKQLAASIVVAKFGKEKAAKMLPGIRITLRDGDDAKETAKLACADQLPGHWFISVKNQFNQPHVLAPNGRPIPADKLTEDDIYSGCWCRAMLKLIWYKNSGNIGVTAIIDAVMKVKDDVRLDSAVTVDSAIKAFEGFGVEDADMMAGVATEGGDTEEGFNFM